MMITIVIATKLAMDRPTASPTLACGWVGGREDGVGWRKGGWCGVEKGRMVWCGVMWRKGDKMDPSTNNNNPTHKTLTTLSL